MSHGVSLQLLNKKYRGLMGVVVPDLLGIGLQSTESSGLGLRVEFRSCRGSSEHSRKLGGTGIGQKCSWQDACKPVSKGGVA